MNRFIEVKCFIGSPHFFWSENESDVAHIKARSISCALLITKRMNIPGYIPDYFENPYEVIFDNEQVDGDPSSYRVQKYKSGYFSRHRALVFNLCTYLPAFQK